MSALFTAARIRWGLAGLLLLAGSGYAVGYKLWQDSLTAPSLSVSVPAGARDLAPGTPIVVTLAGSGARLTAAELTRSTLGEDGAWGPPQPIPVHVALQPSDARSGNASGPLLGDDGSSPIIPDARYTLVLRATGQQAAFPLPWPREVPIEQRVEFSSALSPRPELPAKPVALHAGESIELQWSTPMRQVDATATPPAPVQVQLDPRNPSVGTLRLPAVKEGQEYQLTIQSGIGANGVPLQHPYTLKVVAPVFPHPSVPADPVTLRPGQQRVAIHWNTPLASVDGTISPPVRSHWTLDAKDPRVAYLDLDEYVQGQQYTATITRAQSRDGERLQQPVSFALRTPPALQIVATSPAAGSDARQPITTAPSVTFSEPVADRAAAEAAASVDPPTPGHFEWPDPATLRFVPEQGFPYDTRVTMTVRGGPSGARAVSGAYLQADTQIAFTTQLDKRIEVSLSKQTMYLWQSGQLIRTFPVATGVRGAETPVGQFAVQYKMAQARFRGRNPSGSYYDIPDVHWVLAFYGDYTIHGAYWRHVFGRPGSAGCVSLTDENAKFVYDWAPEGTPVVIHD